MNVFVCGSFDMLHSGHVAFLKQVASYGDVYVGIGKDISILALKKKLPVCWQEERLYMIKSIRYVKDAWVNKGMLHMDFTIDLFKHGVIFDMFIVNTDQDYPEKREFARKYGMKYLVLKRKPEPGLPQRSSTQMRKLWSTSEK